MSSVLVAEYDSISNAEFLQRHAKAGCIGLAGGPHIIEKMIRRAQRRQRDDGTWSLWGHAFVFQGRRLDGQHWVIESDLDIHRRIIRLGVQENRVTKYHDDEYFTNLAVLDFGLDEIQANQLLTEGLNLLASNTKYSLREVFGTFLSLHEDRLRERKNILERDRAMFCSAFVQHLFLTVGIDFAPEIETKNTTPEDIAQTEIPHKLYLLARPVQKRRLKLPIPAKVRDTIKRLT